ncbi:pyridoxamine 5'-phosphate oxidase family protein [Cytobacillus dafuensis]|uniref:Pyridoxamine 5'-phosphate oxidase family protein n=1 Tax=Cytobacillus dafuensis TaxID=1742359 RepID=A0A5B8Z033_CYTDA|nr:pyridoxamine 5'-phosphate oxidase family protein [Cytobacillus dafuensis]QED46320.1 pyridoxamine 5'-phosphate oxidase family protein [Cytobacillus dafuensis]
MLFHEIITSEEELRSLLGTPGKNAANKVINHLDHHCKEFISKSPIVFVSTSNADGHCDTSPRGDFPGFVHIMDDHHFVIPERPGNKRMDTLRNILENPYIGLLFVIPGLEETLRINGKAGVIKDPDILENMTAFGKTPLLGVAVQVEECYIHCAKAFKRSKLWQPETWLLQSDLPYPPQILADHINIQGVDVENVKASLEESYEKRLY